jgi:DNA (cytosine-5)-methyltransferase 1
MGTARVGDVHGSIRNQIMDILIRRLGDHRGAPRLYLDCGALARAGFHPGLSISVATDVEACRVLIKLDDAGSRRVSRKKRGNREIPVIDLNSVEALAGLEDFHQVRVVVRPGAIHVLALASERKAQERLQRLRGRIESGEPLRCAGIAFGAGITSWALHRGLAASGIPTSLAMANELQEEYLDLAAHHNPVCSGGTHLVNAPMQEAVMDDWVVSRVGKVELLEAGIPCSGASRAGVSKRGLAKMEDHPLVGHLVASVIQWIAALQPAIFVAENVPGYAVSASAAILRGWLVDAGYVVHEVELDAHDFGSLEGRVRWFLVAVPPAVDLDLSSMAPEAVVHLALGQLLEDVQPSDPRYRRVDYLKAKAVRDRARGSGFKMQLVDSGSTRVPTLRKGYHKGGSTDPRVRHPRDPELSRLLTAKEHARIKGLDPELLGDASDTLGHQICGQSVDARPVRALGQRIGEALSALPSRTDLIRTKGTAKSVAVAA